MQIIQKVMGYMSGRYGLDELSRVLLVIGLALNLFSNLFGGMIVSIIGIAFIAYGVLRILSKEKNNRYKEFTRYIKWKQTVMTKVQKAKNKQVQQKVYKYYKCSSCKQKVRVPKGRGKIKITCPSCRNQFVKKT